MLMFVAVSEEVLPWEPGVVTHPDTAQGSALPHALLSVIATDLQMNWGF